MRKAIIFGIHGQDGFYLNQLLHRNQVEVIGVSRSAGSWMQGDVGDRNFVESLIQSAKPDYIFHLAAVSKVQHELLFEHQSTIVNGTLNILESVFQFSPLSKIFITGSGLQFVNDEKPVSEKNEFIARDAYSLARIQSVYAARYYRMKGVRAYIGYLFHHDSPLRTKQHLNRKIVDATKTIAAGKEFSLIIGDISVEKEYGFAGDIAAAMFHLLNQDHLFEACIGTGKAYSIEKWLELCFHSINKDWKNYVEINKEFQTDFKKLVSDPSAINATGWKAETEIEELAKLMLTSSHL
jgi:GDPmannose 4,6-dehydratase